MDAQHDDIAQIASYFDRLPHHSDLRVYQHKQRPSDLLGSTPPVTRCWCAMHPRGRDEAGEDDEKELRWDGPQLVVERACPKRATTRLFARRYVRANFRCGDEPSVSAMRVARLAPVTQGLAHAAAGDVVEMLQPSSARRPPTCFRRVRAVERPGTLIRLGVASKEYPFSSDVACEAEAEAEAEEDDGAELEGIRLGVEDYGKVVGVWREEELQFWSFARARKRSRRSSTRTATELRRENAELRRENATLRARVEELEGNEAGAAALLAGPLPADELSLMEPCHDDDVVVTRR